MLAHRYQIWPSGWSAEWDKDEDIEKRYVGITTIAKRDRQSPYGVFNELVCMRLAQLIGLPVPIGMTLERDGNVYFASCHLLAAGGEMPKADLQRFVTDRPADACGITVFDAWIANADRHDENMWYDYYSDGGQFVLFDHGRALLNGSGRVHMSSNESRLGIRLDPPCLSFHMRSFTSFSHWVGLIQQVPTAAIFAATREAATVGVDVTLAEECATWFSARRDRLPELFRGSSDDFPQRERSLLDPFGT